MGALTTTTLDDGGQTRRPQRATFAPRPHLPPSPGLAGDQTTLQPKANCTCGGECPRCQATDHGAVGPISSSYEHERLADQAADEAVGEATAGAAIAAGTAAGDEIPGSLRQHFEDRLGHDFSGVRLHKDASSAAAADGLAAKAFTTGNEISFGVGEYAPHTRAGQHLLAHELSHVIQQGYAAPFIDHGPKPVAFTGSAPRTQLKDKDNLLGGNWWERPDTIKKLIKENDNSPGQEIWHAIEKNDLKGTPSKFRTEVIDGTTHEWRLSVTPAFLDRASPNPGTKYGVTNDTVAPSMEKVKDVDITVHEVPIQVNKILKSSEEDERLFPKGKKGSDESRVNLMAARTLYHEMIHALIRIDKESNSSTQTQATTGLGKKSAKLKNSPKLNAVEQAVKQSISNLVFAAEKITNRGELFAKSGETLQTRAEKVHAEAVADKLDPKLLANLDKAAQDLPFANKSSEHVDFIQQTFDMLIEEKHARQTAGEAFKLKDYQDNSRLVDDYVGQVDSTVVGLAQKQTGRPGLKLEGNKDYDRELQGLRGYVLRMYNLLDTEKDVEPGLGPKLFDSPNFPQPVGIDGNPVKTS